LRAHRAADDALAGASRRPSSRAGPVRSRRDRFRTGRPDADPCGATHDSAEPAAARQGSMASVDRTGWERRGHHRIRTAAFPARRPNGHDLLAPHPSWQPPGGRGIDLAAPGWHALPVDPSALGRPVHPRAGRIAQPPRRRWSAGSRALVARYLCTLGADGAGFASAGEERVAVLLSGRLRLRRRLVAWPG